jgi:hypothetical protein
MATAFDGMGLGMMGSEKSYMSGGKGNDDVRFLLGSLLKMGLDGSKSNVPLPTMPQSNDNKSGGVVPPVQNAVVAPPAPVPAPMPAPVQNTNDGHPEEGNVLKDLGLESFTTPDPLMKSDQSESQAILAQANQPVAPPGGMNLPQYGQGGGGGGGLDIAMKILPMFFGIPA